MSSNTLRLCEHCGWASEGGFAHVCGLMPKQEMTEGDARDELESLGSALDRIHAKYSKAADTVASLSSPDLSSPSQTSSSLGGCACGGPEGHLPGGIHCRRSGW